VEVLQILTKNLKILETNVVLLLESLDYIFRSRHIVHFMIFFILQSTHYSNFYFRFYRYKKTNSIKSNKKHFKKDIENNNSKINYYNIKIKKNNQ
jgi:hypothetical protein